MSEQPVMVLVFRLMHFEIGRSDRADPEDESLGHRSIGTYRSLAAATAAVARLRPFPGFRKWPEGFRIYPVRLDRVGWPDGFGETESDRSFWDWPHEEIVPD